MKILVTGGAGFIGSNVADAYIEAGHEVVVVDNLYTGKRENLHPEARFYLMDIRAPEIRKLLEYERPEVINHHAAQISVPASVEDPGFDASVNIEGFINLLEGARKVGTRKVIFISSGGAIYGEAEEYPTSEDCSLQPLSPYAITKAASESYLHFYGHQYELDYTVLRYSNIYGPRQIPHGEAGVVAIFMDRLLENRPCTLFHFPSEPEGMIRDYCYVGDVVEANLLALEAGNKKAVNIGTGKETRTQILFETIFDVISSRRLLSNSLMTPDRTLARPGDLKKSCLKINLAEDVLGWKPRTVLSEGIEKTLDWRMGR
ncbi:MAG: NAD-dependent epimerase/dehydratase family protein [Deltaproteobacteria bacterium]|nr:NAD-dependent epimerase/dehydratase family protein [Deltaproteobacteria bacterium]MBW2098774.1 NAD-dependent epimerase/dehydratase family protein [Deltaproteobacteria bacterium]